MSPPRHRDFFQPATSGYSARVRAHIFSRTPRPGRLAREGAAELRVYGASPRIIVDGPNRHGYDGPAHGPDDDLHHADHSLRGVVRGNLPFILRHRPSATPAPRRDCEATVVARGLIPWKRAASRRPGPLRKTEACYIVRDANG